jgi:hypothetical protein
MTLAQYNANFDKTYKSLLQFDIERDLLINSESLLISNCDKLL